MVKILLILSGGALGALGRYALSGAVYRVAGALFPWGTLCVNLLGCYLIGLLWELSEFYTIGPATRSFLFIGVLGAFTTFSTFGLETVNLVRDNELSRALGNLLLSNGLGILLVFAGLWTAKAFIPLFR